jgi:hypothetical protein
MAKRKKRYIVLVPCRNTKKDTRYEPGDFVLEGDFTKAVIKNWLEMQPPVLEEVVESGRDTKR